MTKLLEAIIWVAVLYLALPVVILAAIGLLAG